jgi:ribosomal protein S18 acetylase RimI-like enzyme
MAVDDGHQSASLYDICICPSWRHQGLGSALVQHMVAALLRRGYTNITLAARPQHVMWYCQLGFLPDPDAVMVV